MSNRTLRVYQFDFRRGPPTLRREGFFEDGASVVQRVPGEKFIQKRLSRKSFLEEYGYSLRFQLYLINERRLTVAAATKALEDIIMKDPPPCKDGRKLFDDLRPFTQRTVHRWMLKLGCRYEKSTVSYYTDTHEAEETKKDFKERCKK